MNKILFLKTKSKKIKIGSFIVGKLTKQCSIDKITKILEEEVYIDVYDEQGYVDDCISRKISEIGNSIFVGKKINLPNENYHVIVDKFEDSEL